MISHKTIAVLPGDGIGPEVMAATIKVLQKIQELFATNYKIVSGLVGGAAIDIHARALPEETLAMCDEACAVLFGSVGGPKWANLPPDEQPERASLLALRQRYSLFCNLRPAVLHPHLITHSPLNPVSIAGGFQILCVRELTSGIYFGQPKGREGHGAKEAGFDTMRYDRGEVQRIAHIAFQAARQSRQKVTSVDKANVLHSMMLWREVVNEVHSSYQDVTLEHLYVDNAAMQLVRDPKQFDVLLCGNLFGDILSDLCAMATGSLGMLPSASINENGFGLYEPAGGSAPDIAGKDLANPIAQILSLALLFKYSLGRSDISEVINRSVEKTLASGIRTQEMSQGAKKIVGTQEMGISIAANLEKG